MSATPEELSKAVIRLAQGGVVAFPTETVYGLGADALNPGAIARVYALKGRPSHNPLIVHASGAAMARRVVAEWPEAAQRLARAFWPGPLTLVLPKAPGVPASVTAGGPTVAVRVPDHPLTLALLERFGGPLVGPSANSSGRVSPTTAQHVRDAFSEVDVLVLDGGPCRGGIESTVVDLTGPEPRVLRPGLVSAGQVAAALGRPVALGPRGASGEGGGGGGEPLRSPGLLAQHYAPRAPAVLFDAAGWDGLVRARGAGGPIVALAVSPVAAPPPHRVIAMPADAAGYAARLYAALREADDLRPSLIAVERPPAGARGSADAELWSAILDRLSRATAPA